jgi:hypothetical protein
VKPHGFRPPQLVTGDESPDACYELLFDVTVHGGRRFCLLPRAAHLPSEVDALRTLLRKLEWTGEVQGWESCPDCAAPAPDTFVFSEKHGLKPGVHEPSCELAAALQGASVEPAPIPMVLLCPECSAQHIDAPEPSFSWSNPPHRSHKCRRCGCIWRPADVATTGVAALTTRGKADTWGRR